MSKPPVQTFFLKPTKLVPNSHLPLLYYPAAFPKDVSADTIEAHFTKNNWDPQWRFGMYKQAHFHTTTHEALGIFRGSARVRFGASDKESAEEVGAIEVDVAAGDALIIPCGVAHRCVEDRGGFMMVGAYPQGAKQWDLNYGGEGKELQATLPEMDPVLGESEEGLRGLWK